MYQVVVFSIFLIIGLVCSQLTPLLGKAFYDPFLFWSDYLTMVFLSFIMIQVGMEFKLDKSRVRDYGKDYLIAFTTATFPWIFCAIYFVCCFDHPKELTDYQIWTESLLVARFSAPTSAGVLFTMLAASGLSATWVFRKARVLAIFDDLDTILLMVPIKMLLIGPQWSLAIMLLGIGLLFYLGWRYLNQIHVPFDWYWVLLYSVVVVIICEMIYHFTSLVQGLAPVHFEVLLPAFFIGCMIALPDNSLDKLEAFLETRDEKRAKTIISALFMFFVGLSLPALFTFAEISAQAQNFLEIEIGGLTLGMILIHVAVITLLSNLGKMFPLFCYRNEATWQERLALSLSMCPRGEVGAGIIAVSLSLTHYIEDTVIIVAMFSLAVNLLLTGFFIMTIKWLLNKQSV